MNFGIKMLINRYLTFTIKNEVIQTKKLARLISLDQGALDSLLSSGDLIVLAVAIFSRRYKRRTRSRGLFMNSLRQSAYKNMLD